MRARLCFAICALLFLCTCDRTAVRSQPDTANAAGIVVHIITPLSHQSLAQTIDGFSKGLAEKGYGPDRVQLKTLNANGDIAKVSALVKAALAEKPRLVFVLTTSAAQEAVKLTNDARVPLVYAAVTDPVAAGIVSSMENSQTLATGVSDRYPVDEQVKVFLGIVPTLKRVGVLVNPREENSRILSADTVKAFRAFNVEATTYEVLDASKVGAVTRAALAGNDAVVVNGDNLVTENLGTVIELSRAQKKPLFVGDPDSVRRGGLATVGPSYFDLGRVAGYKASQILSGMNASSIPSEGPRSFDYIVNMNAAQAIGLRVPETFWTQRELWESTKAASQHR